MKQFFSFIVKLLIIVAFIALTILLVLKIKEDTIKEKSFYEEMQNIEIESSYISQVATDKISQIKNQIEEDIGTTVELADTGSITKIDLYFVAKVDNEYKYIVKKDENGLSKFAIAQNSDDDGMYIISPEVLGLKDCIYTDGENYIIDKQGNVVYTDSKK